MKPKIKYGDICLVDPMNSAKQKRYGISIVSVLEKTSAASLFKYPVWRCFDPDNGVMINITENLLYPVNINGINNTNDMIVTRFDDKTPEVTKADIDALDSAAYIVDTTQDNKPLSTQLRKLATKLDFYSSFRKE